MFRPMRRFKQQVSQEKCVEILKNEWRGVLAVLGDDGYPYTIPFFFLILSRHKCEPINHRTKARQDNKESRIRFPARF